MKHSERMLFRKSVLLKPLACIALAASTLSIVPANATLVAGGINGPAGVWCLGDGSPVANIPGFPDASLGIMQSPFGLGPLPPDTWDAWGTNSALTHKDSSNNIFIGDKLLSAAKYGGVANDVYAVQLNYWNSIVAANPAFANKTGYTEPQHAPFGHSTGHSCMGFVDWSGNDQRPISFWVHYPADAPKPDSREVAFLASNPNDYPKFAPYKDGPTVGGPTGYVSIYKGCSWDDHSCTPGSKIPGKNDVVVATSDINHFPQPYAAITSIPTSWSIETIGSLGNPFDDPNLPKNDRPQIWDASWDIWFDKDGHTAEGQAPYGSVRGQNDGLEIMVWMNSKGSYVDAYDGKGSPHGVAGKIQPTGSIREQAMIDGVLYDVWVGRLNNPYFGYTTSEVLNPDQIPGDCKGTKGKGAAGTLCGVEWNVVSFVATKLFSSGPGGSGTRDYRRNQNSINAKIFTDYLLGIDRGPRAPQDLGSWYTINSVDNRKANHTPLKCPASNKDQSLSAPTSNCLDPSWYLMSVQAGFETWSGGNGLRSTNFNAYVMTGPSVVGSIGVNNQGQPIITGNSIDVVYSDPGCKTVSANNHAYYTVTGYDAKGNFVSTQNYDMIRQKPDGSFEAWLSGVSTIVGKATITFSSSCGANAVLEVFIDPSGQVFYADGVTPLPGATVTLSYSPSGNSAGPYVVVPQNATNPIMQPNDNTTNPMTSASNGGYGWNVIPGWYKVTATFNGVTVTTSAQQVTATHPITGLNIVLPVTAPPPAARPARVTSQWVVNNVVRQLTSPDSTANDAEMHAQPTTSSWNTQDWVIEPVAGNNHVRLKNIRTGNYLTAQGTTPVEYAKVVGDSFRADWTSEEWIVEPVAATNDVRLKNAFNLRYLTVVDNSNFSGIQMQTLSPQNWTSQRWVIQ